MIKGLSFSVIMLTLIFQVHAQHVGIGIDNPIELLDVNGNINVRGSLLMDGDSGTIGDVLMRTNAGTGWSPLSSTGASADQFNHFTFFMANGSFTVPSGVSAIMIEGWSGGGGGGGGGGGAGGNYAKVIVPVTESQSFTIKIGSGGTAGLNTEGGGAGGITTISATGVDIVIPGGSGAGNLIAGVPGLNTTQTFAPTLPSGSSRLFLRGSHGGRPDETWAHIGNNQTVQLIYNGNGGNAAQTTQTGGEGGRWRNFNNSITNQRSIPGLVPGGGGGGSYGDNKFSFGSGGNGLVIIRW